MTEFLNKYKELTDTVKFLLSPDGCPWDRQQTHDSLKHYLIEEAYEFVEAVEENDYEKMEEELGDLLFHVVIHAVIAEKSKAFTLESVAEKITQKMVRRHPHVFGAKKVSSIDDVWKNWDRIKSTEKNHSNKKETLLNNIPKHLPALLRAEKLQKRAARIGFDWADVPGVWDKMDEEMAELKEAVQQNSGEKIKEEIGDFIFTVVNMCRKYGVDAEEALQQTNRKFIHRFSYMESRLADLGKELSQASLPEKDRLWDEAKDAHRK